MVPAVWRYRVETSLASNTSFGPHNMTAVLGVLKILVGVMFFHLPIGIMMQTRGVEGGGLLDFIWRTRQIRAAFGHSSDYPDTL